MRRVVLDTNIILDIALQRVPFFAEAVKIFELFDQKEIVGCITSNAITDIYYLCKKQNGHSKTLDFLKNLVEIIDVIGVDKFVIADALVSELTDFEDAVLVAAADLNSIDAIITRNKKDFTPTTIDVFTPKEFLENVNS